MPSEKNLNTMNESKTLLFTSEVKSYDANDHTIISFISTKNADYVGDTVDPNGLELKRLANGQPKQPVVLWNHDDSLPAVGKCLYIDKTKDGLIAKTKFAPTTMGKELETLYSNGFITDFSVRLQFDSAGIEENQSGGLNFKSYNIPEYSLVNIGCNWEAVTKSLPEFVEKIESVELKKDFDSFKEKRQMEDKIKCLECDLMLMQTQITDLIQRVGILEADDIIDDTTEPDVTTEPVVTMSTPETPMKVLSLEDFKLVANKIFK